VRYVIIDCWLTLIDILYFSTKDGCIMQMHLLTYLLTYISTYYVRDY